MGRKPRLSIVWLLEQALTLILFRTLLYFSHHIGKGTLCLDAEGRGDAFLRHEILFRTADQDLYRSREQAESMGLVGSATALLK